MLPESPAAFFLFLFTLFMGTGVTVAFCMLVYMISFFTLSPQGIRMPFASMQNVPLRIYSGDLYGAAAWQAAGLQLFWLLALFGLGRIIDALAMKKITVQGG